MRTPRSDGTPLLTLEGIYMHWGSMTVLDHVDLTVPSARLLWLGGANGVGKTTLLRIASGLLLPEEGRVSLNGLTPDRGRRAFNQRVAFLSAGNSGLYARLTVRQNLEFVAGIALLPAVRARAAVGEALRRFALTDLEDRRVDRMSMGQRQRVRIAMTFLNEPIVVLLDEPRTSLDEHGIELLGSALEELLARGGGAIWCSPRGDEPVLDEADRYVLEDGKVKRR